MSSLSVYTKLQTLPSGLKKEVKKLIKSIFDRRSKEYQRSEKSISRKRRFGSLKGKIHMADDFDATSEEFHPYC